MSGNPEDLRETPIAWEVTSIADKPYFDPQKRSQQPQPCRQRFATKAEADARKRELQRDGCVATATPIYLSKRARENRNRKRQNSPFGEFCKHWRMKP